MSRRGKPNYRNIARLESDLGIEPSVPPPPPEVPQAVLMSLARAGLLGSAHHEFLRAVYARTAGSEATEERNL